MGEIVIRPSHWFASHGRRRPALGSAAILPIDGYPEIAARRATNRVIRRALRLIEGGKSGHAPVGPTDTPEPPRAA